MDKLSKKEKIQQKRNEELERFAKEERNKKIKKWAIIAAVVLAIGWFSWWVISVSSKPLPGKDVEDLGRGHVEIGKKIKYNSNPPTSGEHYPDWVKAGTYESPRQDEYLVHSLEHGYIIMSYNCEKLSAYGKWQIANSFIAKAYAQELQGPVAPPSSEASPAADLSGEAWNSDSCQNVKKELGTIAEEVGTTKLIIIPRPTMDTPIALTAWTRIDTMDKVEKNRIIDFINAFRDHGPEKTMEP